MILQDKLLQDICALGRQRRDDEVAAVRAQHFGIGQVGGNRAQADVADLGAQLLEQGREQQVALEIIRGNGDVDLRRVGIEAIDETARALGLEDVRLHDYVRDVRRPTDPPRLSSGSARELAAIFGRIATRELRSPAVSRMLEHWLGLNTDLSMVASSLDLDPLAHAADGPALALMNKTGTDTGVRADCGLVSYGGVQVAYAAIANWEAASESTLGDVMADMRLIGGFVRRLVEGDDRSGA